ncbi:Glycosyl transferase family 2 [Modestobacter sp. DSM 44400]|uniref:glycosyltransferase family 2 protein n=1 Tax=Modestobacter sp. DSM 44400 TaxID=1550230 RepID=UPI00089D3838|nr:glycosyltransferase family A protein [Modestobacter sp. DSM 44400]SDY66676.1 Glycosyl transferase family 2 [Modestobacter sp. DSM 44400]
MRMLDVSVVIPTFNRPHLLTETLDSVLAQTVRPSEIIVVDNGTTDATAASLVRYGTQVTHIRTEPAGVQAARNTGLDAASCTWVATLDDDDLYRPTFLEQAAPALLDGRPNLVFGDHRKFIRGAGLVSEKTNAERAPDGYWNGIAGPASGVDWTYVGTFPVERLLLYNVFYPSTMIVQRDLVDRVGGFDPAVRGIKTEDMEFMTRALPAARLAFAWAAQVDYRMHESNNGGDLLAQYIGRWRIFEYVRQKDQHGSAALAAALEADLSGRRRAVIRTAFRHGELDVLPEVAARLHPEDRTLLTRALLNIARLPRPVAGRLIRAGNALLPRPAQDRAHRPQWVPGSPG